MGNLPIVKDLVVDMAPFWEKFRAVEPWLAARATTSRGQGVPIPQERMNASTRRRSASTAAAASPSATRWSPTRLFLGPQALAKGFRFVGDPRDGATVERLEDYNGEHGIWECTRCYFCNERCPKGVDPRDAIAKLGAESIKHGIDRDMGAKHARWFVKSAKTTGWLRETELVPKTQGVDLGDQADEVRARSRSPRQGPARSRRTWPTRSRRRARSRARARAGAPRRRRDHPGRARAREAARAPTASRSLRPVLAERAPSGRPRGRRRTHADARRLTGTPEADAARGGPEAGRVLQGLPRVALGEGARHVDARARAEGRARAGGARGRHLLRRRRHPRGRADYYLHLNARILAYAEATGADTLMTICNVCTLNLRQANWQLQNDDALRDASTTTSTPSACRRTPAPSRCGTCSG